jgi:hypothetical protein
MTTGTGWGSGGWGSSEWGGNSTDAGTPVGALAISENVVQLAFTEPIYFSQLFDANDGSDPAHFTVTPVLGTAGSDGNPTRAVSVLQIAQGGIDADGNSLYEITLDRPMSAYPAAYVVVFAGLFNESQTQSIDDGQVVFPAVSNALAPPIVSVAVPSRDFANPQTLVDTQASNFTHPTDPTLLGTYSADDTGDYASDDAPTGFKKRIFRRLITKKNAFVFLPGYGVGITGYGKKLASAALRAQLATEIETQIAQEPETLSVKASIVPDPSNNGRVRVPISIKTRNGAYVKINPSFPVG